MVSMFPERAMEAMMKILAIWAWGVVMTMLWFIH